MRKALALVMVGLFIAAAAWAAPGGGNDGAKPQWWPGEGPAAKNTVAGKVTAISASGISIETKRGAAEFAITEQTKVRVRGEDAEIDDIEVGDRVIVHFALNQGGSKWARGIAVPAPEFVGRITAIDGDSFTLTGKERAWNVTLMSDTKVMCRKKELSASDLLVGYGASVVGVAEGDNVQAKVVHFRPTVIKGVVDSVNEQSVIVKTVRQLTVTAAISDATIILIRPRTAANRQGTLSDIKPGTPVNIGGHIIGEGAMEAIWIDLLTAGPDGAGAARKGTMRPGAKRPARQP